MWYNSIIEYHGIIKYHYTIKTQLVYTVIQTLFIFGYIQTNSWLYTN